MLARELGTFIARWRHELGLSQQALAESIQMSTNHVQLMESGLSDRKKMSPANPRLNTLVALSAALKIPLPEMLGQVVGNARTRVTE